MCIRDSLTTYLMEPGSLVMERKMLLGIKQRAERGPGPPDPAASDQPAATTRHHAAPSSGEVAASS